MFYLLDSDAAKKLAQYDLLNELAFGLNCSLADFAILPQLRFQLKLNQPSKAMVKLGSAAALKAANELITAASEISVSQSDNPFLGLNCPDIDTGEQTLFAALYEQQEDELISGDKRAYIALAKVENALFIEGLWPRLLCLEEAFSILLRSHKFTAISEKVRARPDVDSALRIIFGISTANDLDAVMTGLLSYKQDLCSRTNQLYPVR